jgi:D-tyrosyl-tRNA(Tyr) deacylase
MQGAMRAVIQRVTSARVVVKEPDGSWRQTGAIGHGLCALIGVAEGDTEADAALMADKISTLRIFEDAHGKMNDDVFEVAGGVLAVSQFTLLGDVRKGRRPAFTSAMAPEPAKALYLRTCGLMRARGLHVEEGEFRATMRVELVNDGPVTLLLDTRKQF